MLHWGIAGLGKIAHKFLNDLQLVPENQIVAVGSRSLEKATSFANQYRIESAHGSYTDLFENPKVEIIYIATPHHAHAEVAIEAMQAGKHVLCEKPIAVSRAQAADMIQVAKEHRVFLMEALWTRFNPTILKVVELVKDGELGTVNFINADFSFYSDAPVEGRLFNMNLAGGALLDVGIYPVFLAYLLMGMPDTIEAKAIFHPTGADLQTAAIFKYKKGIAQVMGGLASHSDMRARIGGNLGSIFLEPRWHETESFTWLDHRNQTEETYHFPKIGKGYTYEIQECMACIQAEQLESQLWSWQNSLDLITLLDTIRAKIGLTYPFET